MNRHFNLPPGCLAQDLDGGPMPRCEVCGEEHNDWKGNGRCDECQPVSDETDSTEEMNDAPLPYAAHRR